MKRPDLEAAAEQAKYGASPPEMGQTISDLLAYVRHLEAQNDLLRNTVGLYANNAANGNWEATCALDMIQRTEK